MTSSDSTKKDSFGTVFFKKVLGLILNKVKKCIVQKPDEVPA